MPQRVARELIVGDRLVPAPEPQRVRPTALAPTRDPASRSTGADLDAHREVYHNVAARVPKKQRVSPGQPVPDREFFAGTDMYFCKKRKSERRVPLNPCAALC